MFFFGLGISDYHRAIGITLSASLGEACYAWDKDKPDGGDADSYRFLIILIC